MNQKAFEELRHATLHWLDVLERVLVEPQTSTRAPKRPPATPAQPARRASQAPETHAPSKSPTPPAAVAAAPSGPKRPTRGGVGGPIPGQPAPSALPTPLTKAPAALSDEMREENLPRAIEIARGIKAVLGAGHPQLRPGLQGQLALEHIQYDGALLDAALEGV